MVLLIKYGDINEITEITKIIKKISDFTPGGMINALDLLRPIYKKTAVFGHFWRKDKDFTWESTDKVSELQTLICTPEYD